MQARLYYAVVTLLLRLELRFKLLILQGYYAVDACALTCGRARAWAQVRAGAHPGTHARCVASVASVVILFNQLLRKNPSVVLGVIAVVEASFLDKEPVCNG